MTSLKIICFGIFVYLPFSNFATEQQETEIMPDSFRIFLFEGYIELPTDFFIHGMWGNAIELTSFEKVSHAKIYYKKDPNQSKLIELMNFEETTLTNCYGFTQFYGENGRFGNVIYLYDDEQAFYMAGVSKPDLEWLLAHFIERLGECK